MSSRQYAVTRTSRIIKLAQGVAGVALLVLLVWLVQGIGNDPRKAGGLVAMVGVLLAIWSVFALLKHWRLSRIGVIASGSVIRIDTTSGTPQTPGKRSFVIRFMTTGGEDVEYTTSDIGSLADTTRVGSSVSIRYDPAHARRAEVVSRRVAWTRIAGLFLFASIFIGAGILIIAGILKGQ